MFDKVNILDSVNQSKPEMLDGASRYAAVNKHFSEVSLSSPSTIIVLTLIILLMLAVIVSISISAIKAKRVNDRLKNDARRNSYLARRKYKVNKKG